MSLLDRLHRFAVRTGRVNGTSRGKLVVQGAPQVATSYNCIPNNYMVESV